MGMLCAALPALLATLLATLPAPTSGANILALLPLASPSHHSWNSALLSALAARGHKVTALSVDAGANTNTNPNLTYLPIDDTYDEVEGEFEYEKMAEVDGVESIRDGFQFLTICCKSALRSEGMRTLLQSPPDARFDLVVAESVTAECLLGVVPRFGHPPLVLINAFTVSQWVMALTGSPNFPSFMQHKFVPAPKEFAFRDRVANLYTNAYGYVTYFFGYLPEMDELAKERFGEGVPNAWDALSNASIALANYHPAFDHPWPLTPNVIPVGGLHIKDPKPLPSDLQKYLDEAKEGAIFFSLGTNVQSDKLPLEKLQHILDAFREIPQKVLWKFESDFIPNLPKNVMISKWLPQSDILVHPNVKIFISHCGLLSTHEAIHRGMPIIGIPFISDQHVNIARLVEYGAAVRLPFRDLTNESLLNAINNVLYNTSYKENMKLLSERFRDNLQTPLETAVYWMEYVIRHKGARHLRPASLDLNVVQHLLLDVIAFIVAALVALLTLFTLCCRLCCKKSKKMKQS